MAVELRTKLQSLRAVSSKLNASTDQAAELVREVERLLGEELSLGVSAEAPTWFSTELYEGDDQAKAGWQDDEGNPAPPDVCYSLAYGRVGGKFRLHVVAELSGYRVGAGGILEGHTITLDRTPWGSCGRQVKLESFSQLPSLLGEIVKEAERMIGKAEETAESVRGLLEARHRVTPPDEPVPLRGGPGPAPGEAGR